MATQSKRKSEQKNRRAPAENPAEPVQVLRAPWPARTTYKVGGTRRARQAQYRQQINMLVAALSISALLGIVFVVANWAAGGGLKPVNCANYPEFCVPLAGGHSGFAQLEAASARELDGDSAGAPGVVRYIDANNVATLGDPAAPIHFVTVSDYACPHCQRFHKDEVPRFIDEYVLTGRATFGFVMATGTGQVYSEVASKAALCAGEQGAFWEMSEEFFREAGAGSIDQKFTAPQIRETAADMSLDDEALVECLTSNRYDSFMQTYRTFITDHGVSGTPTILVSYGDTNIWNIVDRSYDNMARLTEAEWDRQQ